MLKILSNLKNKKSRPGRKNAKKKRREEEGREERRKRRGRGEVRWGEVRQEGTKEGRKRLRKTNKMSILNDRRQNDMSKSHFI